MCRSSRSSLHLLFLAAVLFLLPWAARAQSGRPDIPAPLKMWEGWATWDDLLRNAPTAYHSAEKPLNFWPSRLNLRADTAGGSFDLEVTVFATTWIPLPGSREVWPIAVLVGDAPVPVVEQGGAPSIELSAGVHRITGSYRWVEIPSGLKLPREIGILNLSVEGKSVAAPAWDAEGQLWLRRDRISEEVSKDFLAVKIYAVVEDGIPLWLRTRIELVVSGKSREENIGGILPEGWQLSSLESPLPIAVDAAGRFKAQVRAGKWTIQANAFHLQNPKSLRYAADPKPAVAEQLVAFRPKPDFRLVEITGAPSIDVSQTSFPDEWRNLAVYRWETATEIGMEERMRGMGLQKPAGLQIKRDFWLDDHGRGLTFRDSIRGELQQIWRLDIASGQELGSVRKGEEGQLITRNPQNGAAGFEIRTRKVYFEATGRIAHLGKLPASGWNADAESVNVNLNLPPGWRLFAVFGADYVQNDWLTAWTLLDLFLLLIFSLAVFKLWGFRAALLAILAFGLSYQEAYAPRYLWLALLVPVALLRVVPVGWGRRLLQTAKWLTAAVLMLHLVLFLTLQVQQALYPQLEPAGSPGLRDPSWENYAAPPTEMSPLSAETEGVRDQRKWDSSLSRSPTAQLAQPAVANSNLLYDSKARIQTGPAVPEWIWRNVRYGWNGPVLATQEVRVVLISLAVERMLTISRVVLLLALAGVLLNAFRFPKLLFRTQKAAALMLFFALLNGAPNLQAQFPDQTTLDTLRQRLLEPSDVYPHAADIPSVTLAIKDGRLILDAEIHAAIRTAVPLPGRLPVWSPVTVLVDGKPEVTLRRDDAFLWLVLEKGVHQVHAEGLLPGPTEWEWTFHLAPHHVTIDAPGWTVSGVKPDGTPEAQVFFALQQKSVAGEATYDRQDLQPLVSVERRLELGLTWQLRTTVKRLSPVGKALALRIPLLAGENVLSANIVPLNGALDLRLGAQEGSFTWVSELPVTNRLPLSTRTEDSWVESWFLVVSSVWNVGISGLAPVFEPDNQDLVPVWHPWPGENADLTISRPEAIAGPTVTVNRGLHDITLGQRQRVSRLDFSLRCSLGEDFLITLPAEAEVTALTLQDKPVPVRKEGQKVIVPLSPGEQNISVTWKTNVRLGFKAEAEKVVLPVESANIETVMHVPDDRWVLWTSGPQRGPAVRFWVILVCSLLVAAVLARLALSPLRPLEWMLLTLGLTQVPLGAALAVVAWLFLLAWRGRDVSVTLPRVQFHLLQLLLFVLTAISLGVVIAVVSEGLLGRPEMFIGGNRSTVDTLKWYLARSGLELPRPECFSVSIWWYRFLMLLWALWLAFALIRWLTWGWQQFSKGGCFRPKVKKAAAPQGPPPLPT